MSTKKNMLWFGAIFIFVLSVITFIAIPTAGKSSNSATPVFGKWNGKPIEYVQDSFFIRQLQALSQQLQSQGQQVNQYNQFQIMQSAFDAAAVRYAVLDELKAAGYKVPASVVNKALISYYSDENGKYSATLYNQTSEAVRSSRRATLTEELTAQRYAEDLFGTQSGVYGLKISSKETNLVKTMSNPERSFVYASFDTASYPDAEAVAWGQANSALFVKHSLSLITFDSEATAKKVSASLAKGSVNFDDAVTTYSTRTGTDTAGKLTDSFRYNVNGLFADAKDLETVLALKPAAISGIVKAGSAFAIVRCDAAPAEPAFTDPAVAAAVKSYMGTNERGKIEDYFVAKAKEFGALAKQSGFDAACKAAGLEKKTTKPFGLNYGNANIMSPLPVDANPELASAPKSETFFKTAFSLPAGDVSEPILLGTNVVVLQLAEEVAPDAQITEMVPMFFSYYASSWSQSSLSQAFLKSKKLENNFMATYLKYFLN